MEGTSSEEHMQNSCPGTRAFAWSKAPHFGVMSLHELLLHKISYFCRFETWRHVFYPPADLAEGSGDGNDDVGSPADGILG